MKQQVNISKLAYQKAVFHALKYPSSNIIGILVGKGYDVSNAYPLFHTPIVSPSLQIAFGLVESQLPQGQSILGIYSSAVNCESAIADVTNKLLENIKKVSSSQPITMNIFLQDLDQQKILNYNVFVGIQKQKATQTKHNYFEQITKDISDGRHRQLIDIDSHFENIELDFTNSYLVK